jgi:hydroxyacylglutathione hydrolase
VFLLTNGEKNLLIDTSPKFLWRLLTWRLNKLNIRHINFLILTHTHMDHAGNSAKIKEKYKALVIVHQSEASFLTTGDNIIPKGTNSFSNLLINLAKNIAPLIRYKPCAYDLTVDKRLELNDYGFNAYIMHTPGHTKGSISVIVDNEVAIVGDCMFGIFNGSVFPPFATDIGQMIESWGKLLDTGCSLFLPSHGSADNRLLVEKDYHKRMNKIREQTVV